MKKQFPLKKRKKKGKSKAAELHSLIILIVYCKGYIINSGWIKDDIDQNNDFLKFKPRFHSRNAEGEKKLRSIAVMDDKKSTGEEKVSLLVLSDIM